ncbi:MAG: extracellular solute-binding protein [Chloroflexi bacterium]|nr:extracellular solute-binding protein [Chloroflexota bacterium]
MPEIVREREQAVGTQLWKSRLLFPLMAVVVGAAGVACGEDEEEQSTTFPPGTQLEIVQWTHIIRQYDKWFDPFASAWGDANGVNVSVNHIDFTELFPTLTAAIDDGEGPAIVELLLASSLFIEGLQDLTDVNLKAQELFGEQIDTCTANSYLPATNTWYGFCHAWIPDPGNYDKELWSQVGYPDGPSTWAELLDGGKKIKDSLGVRMGIGMSPEIDSELAARAVIWSFGGSIQDENENVVINSPEVVEAVNYMADLYRDAMTDEVFGWVGESNNEGLIAGELSYILNSISGYRSLQKADPEAADRVYFRPALAGPRGDRHASAHIWQIYVIPKYVQGAELEAAKAFLLHHTANYNQAVFNSELFNFPAFKSTAPQLYEDGGWLDVDPFGSRPNDKIRDALLGAEDGVAHLGFPGPSNPAVAKVYATHIIPTMMSKVARGELTAEQAVAEAEAQIEEIFAEWRAKGFVGGG